MADKDHKTDRMGELVEFAGKKIPREMISLISNYLENKDLLSLSVSSKDLHEVCESILHERKHQADRSEQEMVSIPKLCEVLPPKFPPPAALATTIPEVTTVSTTGTETLTFPENSQIVVPVLPECIPLVAKVPDVCPEKDSTEGEKQEVKISQILPGYLPSYANDYVPSEVDSHSYNNFVNTMSFNVSRYPTLADVTDSKDYSKTKDKAKTKKEEPKDDDQETRNPKFEYVPAEYFKGPESSFQTAQVKTSQCVSVVNPEVLSSGRVLTNMTIPSLTSLDKCGENGTVHTESRTVSGEADVETTTCLHGSGAVPITSSQPAQQPEASSSPT